MATVLTTDVFPRRDKDLCHHRVQAVTGFHLALYSVSYFPDGKAAGAIAQ